MSLIAPDSRVYVAGHRGMVGSSIWRDLTGRGYDDLIGDASKAKELLGWQAEVLPPELVRIMVDSDIAALG